MLKKYIHIEKTIHMLKKSFHKFYAEKVCSYTEEVYSYAEKVSLYTAEVQSLGKNRTINIIQSPYIKPLL